MTLTIDSTRFGRLEIADEAVIEFPSGLIGLGGSRFALVARDADSAFLWLHSVDDPSLAVPVTNPWQFFEDYAIELSDGEAERIGVTDAANTEVYVTVRAGERHEDFSANLKAPILICKGHGHQVINEAPADVRAPLLAGIARQPVA